MKKIISLALSVLTLFSASVYSSARVVEPGEYRIILYTRTSYENTPYEDVFSDHRNFMNPGSYGIEEIYYAEKIAAFCSTDQNVPGAFYILTMWAKASTREETQAVADELISRGISDNVKVFSEKEFSEFFRELPFSPSLPENRFSGTAGDCNGDIDCTGRVTASDARTALRISVGLENKQNYPYLLGDADLNGEITAADARGILRTAVGL